MTSILGFLYLKLKCPQLRIVSGSMGASGITWSGILIDGKTGGPVKSGTIG